MIEPLCTWLWTLGLVDMFVDWTWFSDLFVHLFLVDSDLVDVVDF